MNQLRPENRAATVRWLIGQCADLLAPLILACLFACLTRLVSLAMYVFAGLGLATVLDLPIPQSLGHPSLGLLVVALVLSGLAKGGLRYAEQFVGHRVAFLCLARLRNTMYVAYERQAPFAAATQNSGGLLSRATRDIDKVEVFFAHTFPPAVAAVVVSSLTVWWVGANFGVAPALILVVAYLIVGVLIPLLGVPSLRRAARTQAVARGAQNQVVAEGLTGIEVIHGFGAGNQLVQRLNAASVAATAPSERASWITGARAALSLATIWGSAVLLAVVSLNPAELGASVILLVIAVPSFEAVRAVDGFVLGLQDSLASAQRLHQTALTKHPVPEPVDPEPFPDTYPDSGVLSVNGLKISLADTTIINNVSFSLAAGELVGLVGASGSGKSSIAAALVQAVPSEGTLSYGATDLRRVAHDQLRSRLVLVSQQAQLVRGTIRENLLLGSAEGTDEQLIEVLTELGLGPWLKKLPKGLDTRLGDRFTRLSGGQRQRLAIARAFLRHPAVLILDEATSALDAQTEQLVLKAIEARRRWGMGALMISHRLSILSHASQVLVLEAGSIAESGTPQELFGDSHSLFYQMALREADQLRGSH